MNVLADIDAANSEGVITLVLALLGLVGVGVGVWLASRREYLGAVIAAVIGLVVLVVALG